VTGGRSVVYFFTGRQQGFSESNLDTIRYDIFTGCVLRD